MSHPLTMVKLLSLSALEITWAGLLLSISLNLAAIYVFRHQQDSCMRATAFDDSRFSRCPESRLVRYPTLCQKAT
ncbi:hypothetical protein C8J57DRAFT_1314915 [Mycena rebaudengoi]|nr:hypothetical protein C8J57DRAFT_1314915 [Mycena rebaudengoi]